MNDSIFKYMEIPYLFNGRSFDGTDCYGLVVLWFKHELGIDLFDPGAIFKNHKEVINNSIFIDHLDDWIVVDEDDIRPNDVALIKKGSRIPTHCGVVLNRKEFLHLEGEPGCTIGKIQLWSSRIYRFYRYKGLA